MFRVFAYVTGVRKWAVAGVARCLRPTLAPAKSTVPAIDIANADAPSAVGLRLVITPSPPSRSTSPTLLSSHRSQLLYPPCRPVPNVRPLLRRRAFSPTDVSLCS